MNLELEMLIAIINIIKFPIPNSQYFFLNFSSIDDQLSEEERNARQIRCFVQNPFQKKIKPQRKFISLSSNHQPDSPHPRRSFRPILLNAFSRTLPQFESNRIESRHQEDGLILNLSPLQFPWISFLSYAMCTHAYHAHVHKPRIRVWWPWLYLRRRKRRITLNLSPLLVISGDHETETKRVTHTPPPPSLVIFDTVSTGGGFRDRRHAKSRVWRRVKSDRQVACRFKEILF